MADGRMIKKNVSTSRKLTELKSDSARLLWTWLLPHLDVAGRFSGEPAVVKGAIVPRLKHLTENKVQELLQELHEAGLIHLYHIEGEQYLEFVRFDDFQNLRPDRESESKIPEPPDNKETSDNSRHTPGGGREFSTPLKDKDKDKDKLKDKDSFLKSNFRSEIDIRLVQLLIDLMLQNNPESSIVKRLTANRQTEWIRACRLLREDDGHTPEQIEAVIRFSQGDSFWKSNILSMPKLREKFDQLWMKAKRGDKFAGIREFLKGDGTDDKR